MASDAITAIKSSLPPETDYLTYLTILESHLSPNILPTLDEILQDTTLTQNIGWDLIQLLIPLPGSETCLKTIARLGNPREVVLKVTEALRLLNTHEEEAATASRDANGIPADNGDTSSRDLSVPKEVDKFCTLVSLLATLHPRIKTKYPSRFLSTSLIAILAAYRPSDQATLAVISFLHSLSGKKRPPLPQRKSSLSISVQLDSKADTSAPDPEATAEEPQEAAIQEKLLQSFITHILEVYIDATGLEWTARMEEHFEPDKIVPGRKSFAEAFREDPVLIDRDMIVGQLVALARDFDLSRCEILFDAIYAQPREDEEEHPSSPDDVPLSKPGSLFLVTYFVFSSVMFGGTNVDLPPLSIFPGHAKLVQKFIGTNGPINIGTEEPSIIDAILAIGFWLEKSNKFVSGALEDDDFLQYLQTLSLISANSPSPTLRYGAHVLLSNILHSHPVDRTRLTFIIDTLENCPYETLRASAVGWLKEELIRAQERRSDDLFSTTLAVASAQPYLFPDMSALAQATDQGAWDELKQTFVSHMAVLNFVYFLSGDTYSHLVPAGMHTVAEEIYLGPLRAVQGRVKAALEPEGVIWRDIGDIPASVAMGEMELLGQRLEMCME